MNCIIQIFTIFITNYIGWGSTYFRDSDAVVRDLEVNTLLVRQTPRHRSIALQRVLHVLVDDRYFHHHHAPRGRELHGVGQQVADDLGQLNTVLMDDSGLEGFLSSLGHVDGQLQIFFFGLC